MRTCIQAAAAGALAVLTTATFAQATPTTTQYMEPSKHHAHRIVCKQAGQTIHEVRDAKDVYMHYLNGQLVRITYGSHAESFVRRVLEVSIATTTCAVEQLTY